MILVTGAAGKTGGHVIGALTARNLQVRGLVRQANQAESITAFGAKEVIVGDMRDAQVLRAACSGARAVYHIAPNMSPDELTIGQAIIDACKWAGVRRFVYHSVLHPQVEDMPHHWLKMRVEEALFKSGLTFTILQPAAYMQNLLGYRDGILERGVYAVPYSVDSRQSLVDLRDVAAVAARVLDEPGHEHAIYELVSPDAPSAREIAALVSAHIGKPVRAEQVDRKDWEMQTRVGGMLDYAVETLLKMFIYYECNNFVGNPNVLSWLLGRPPRRFEQFLQDTFVC
mgnify:CR=1 FL=1